MILCSAPKIQNDHYRADLEAAIRRVLDSGRYILGEEVCAFEKEFADFVGVPHCIGVGSATDAINIALRALNVSPGDEVITVSHTAVATVAAIELAGGVPVLIDIEPDGYNMDPQKLEQAFSSRTKAVVLVHLYGCPANIEAVLKFTRRHGLALIEDCSQAHGASVNGQKVGTWGDAACFSFYPTKNLGGIGDGGAVVTQDADTANRCRRLREYGWDDKRDSILPGLNSRLDELQAAILRVKLRHLEEDNQRRIQAAAFYSSHLGEVDITLPVPASGSGHVYHLYVVRILFRDELKKFLADKGIQTMIHYPLPVHLQSAYQGRLRCPGGMGETQKACAQILSLPMHPQLKQEELETVVDGIKKFYKERA